jgi:CRP-like cAMP-binding protein
MKTVTRDVVRQIPLFAGMSEQEKDDLLREGSLRRYARGQRLFVCGDDVLHFYVLCDGTLQLFHETPDGHEMTVEVLIVGDTIGKTEILQSQSVHRYNGVAVKDSTVMEFPIAWLRETVKGHPTLALNLLAILSHHMQTAIIEGEHKSTMSAPQQVACFLERLCVLHNFDPRGFALPYSKTLIASRLGMELETFSRALAKLRDHGLIIKGAHVSFGNLQKIEGYACDNCSISENCREHRLLREKLAQKPGQAA